MRKVPNRRAGYLLNKINELYTLYKSENDLVANQLFSDEIKAIREDLSKNRSSKKPDILRIVVNNLIYDINTNTYLDTITSSIYASYHDSKTKVEEQGDEIVLDDIIADNYDWLLSHSKESLLKLEKNYTSRFKETMSYFNAENAVAFTYAAFDSAYYGCSKNERRNWLIKNGVSLEKNKNINQYLDDTALRTRVAALMQADKLLTEYSLKAKKLKEKTNDENVKLSKLQYEIFTVRMWEMGYDAYNLYLSIKKEHPLKPIVDRNDQCYLDEATKLKGLKDNRPYKMKQLEKEANADKLAKKLIKSKFGLVSDGKGNLIPAGEFEKLKKEKEGVQIDLFDELLKQGAIDPWDIDDLRNPKKKSKK